MSQAEELAEMLAAQLAAFGGLLESLTQAGETAAGFRASLIRQGFSETIAEQIAARMLASLTDKMLS